MENTSSTIIVAINPNDVLFGRGDWTVRFEGNVRFRDLIREKRNLFGAASGRNARDQIATDIIRIISNRGGRFLRRIGEPDGSNREGNSPSEGSWIVVDKKIAMKKVKQAFRDKDSWTQKVEQSSQQTVLPIPSTTDSGPPITNQGASNVGLFQGQLLQPQQSTSTVAETLNQMILEQSLRTQTQQRHEESEAMRIAALSAALDLQRRAGPISTLDPQRYLQNQLLQRLSAESGSRATLSQQQFRAMQIQQFHEQLQQQQRDFDLATRIMNASQSLVNSSSLPSASSSMPLGGTSSIGLQSLSTTQQINQIQQILEMTELQRRSYPTMTSPLINFGSSNGINLTPSQSGLSQSLRANTSLHAHEKQPEVSQRNVASSSIATSNSVEILGQTSPDKEPSLIGIGPLQTNSSLHDSDRMSTHSQNSTEENRKKKMKIAHDSDKPK